MESESVVFGKWDNHGNEMNLRLSAQNSQKVGEDIQLVYKYGNKQIRSTDDSGDIKYIIEYTLLRSVEGFGMDKAIKAIELFNKYYSYEIDPEEALAGWELENKLKKNTA